MPGFMKLPGAAKVHTANSRMKKYPGAVTLSGKSGDDAKPYQEKQVKEAIEEVKQ
jgi:hypothetical protein